MAATTTADEPKPSILTDPLLPSPESPPSIAYPPPISYVHSPRPFRDLPFLLPFLLLSLLTLSLGIFSISRRHNPPSSPCPKISINSPLYSFPLWSSSSSSSLHANNSGKNHLIWTLVLTLLLSGPIALSLLFLLRRFAKQIVYASLPFIVLVPTFLNLYWFVSCTLSPSCSPSFPLPYRILVLVFVFLVISLLIWILVANWHRIELTVQIVRVSAAALADNLGLLGVLPGLSLGAMVYFGLLVVFLVFARRNGRVETGPDECAWREEGWVRWYFALAIVTMVWTAATMVEVQVYVVSGTVAQWYFAEEGVKPARSIRASFRNAFGPSFGTVCFSGMVMGVVRIVRAIVDSAQHEENAPGFVKVILDCCARFLLSAFDFVNKFTINFAAITGEAYCSSAKMTYELLKRNLLSAVFVETVSTRILVGIIFVLSTVYAIVVFAILKAVGTLGTEIYIIAAIAWLLLMVVLGYFVHVLDNVIDAIYVCYAIDRDRGDVSKQEVHEVYVMLPVTRNHRPPLVDRTPSII